MFCHPYPFSFMRCHIGIIPPYIFHKIFWCYLLSNIGHYRKIMNCDCLEENHLHFTCSVLHSSDTYVSIYLGNNWFGNLSTISISFWKREMVLLTTYLKNWNKTFGCSVETSWRASWVCLLLSKCHSTPGWATFSAGTGNLNSHEINEPVFVYANQELENCSSSQ